MSRRRAIGIRQRLLSFAPGLAVTWAGFWGLVTWNVFANASGPGAVIGGVATVVAGLLPAAMLYMRRKPAVALVPPTDVPKAVRPEYKRLLSAYDHVTSLVGSGVVEESVLHGVKDRIDELVRLMSADLTNQELGGRPSAALREQIEQLTDLLVGLADAALDRRSAALDGDDQAAASLREALGRMRAEERGFNELDELDENR